MSHMYYCILSTRQNNIIWNKNIKLLKWIFMFVLNAKFNNTYKNGWKTAFVARRGGGAHRSIAPAEWVFSVFIFCNNVRPAYILYIYMQQMSGKMFIFCVCQAHRQAKKTATSLSVCVYIFFNTYMEMLKLFICIHLIFKCVRTSAY